MIHQERKFSVLCRKRYKSFNFEAHVGVDVLHLKLSFGGPVRLLGVQTALDGPLIKQSNCVFFIRLKIICSF